MGVTGFHMFVFFQAEDGIRDIGVTGVQTCALPIFAAAGFIAVQPIFWAFPTSYLGGVAAAGGIALIHLLGADRKSVVEGKSVDLGGRRIIKKKKNLVYASCLDLVR